MMRLVQSAVDTMVVRTMLRQCDTAAACSIWTITTDTTLHPAVSVEAILFLPGFTGPLLYSYPDCLQICISSCCSYSLPMSALF